MVTLQEYVDRKSRGFIESMRVAKSHREWKDCFIAFDLFLLNASNVGADCKNYSRIAEELEEPYLGEIIRGGN